MTDKPSNVQRFIDLFQGYDKAHGRYATHGVGDRGKMEGRARTVGSGLLHSDWIEHLTGKGDGVGVIPLTQENACWFAVIDVDQYPLDLAKLEQSINKMSLPLTICRSKSGGAHLYIFFSEPVPAAEVVEKLHKWAAYLGYGTSEIFPKQTYRATDRDIGNWINLPYYNMNSTERYAIKDGQPLSAMEFLNLAEARRKSKADFHNQKISEPKQDAGLFSEGPPCLRHLSIHGGFPQGTRNDGMYNVGIYLRKRYQEDWEKHLAQYNVEMCDPPLDSKELTELVKSLKRKDYQYKCNQAPIKPFCNRRVCYKQMYGVGETEGSDRVVEVGHMVKYEGDPVIWVVELDGVRTECTTKDLTVQGNFINLCMDKINRFPTPMPAARWSKYIDERVKKADIVPVPEEASHEGQFWLLVEQFISGKVMAVNRDELLLNKPWKNDGKVHFRSRALLEYLDNHRFRYKSEHHVWQMLRKRGGSKTFLNLKGKGCNVWWIPLPELPDDEPAPLPSVAKAPF